jgi:hypothetical protein
MQKAGFAPLARNEQRGGFAAALGLGTARDLSGNAAGESLSVDKM